MINILIVDDEPFIRQGLKILINWKLYGYNIIGEATNGNEALKFIETNKVDLIITDIKMPEMDGLALVKKIYEKCEKRIKCIMLSGYYEFEYAKTAIKYGVKDYILKPIEREELINILVSFKEEYEREEKEYIIRRKKERMIYERHFNLLLCNGYTDEDLRYVLSNIKYNSYLRYINIEIIKDKKIAEDYKYNKKIIFNKLLDWLGSKNYYNLIFDVIKEDKLEGIGLIFSNALSEELGINEQQYIERVKEILNSINECECNLLVGKKVFSIEDISESYKSLYVIKVQEKISRIKKVYYYDDISSKKIIDYDMINANVQQLIKSIEDNNIKEIESFIDILFKSISNDTNSLRIIKIYIDYLLCNLINIVKGLDANKDKEEVVKNINRNLFDKIEIYGNIEEFKKFCIETSNYIKDLRSNSTHNILSLIDKEVSDNYMKPLTLKYLSEKYYLNTAYLGQLFKKSYNKSFKDYLNDYRIEKAAAMIRRSNEKIYRIAEDVGYNNTDYFISKFVQAKGITPLQYRRKYRV